MLIIREHVQEHFNKVCAFAALKGAHYSEMLWEQLWYLHTYGDTELGGMDVECPRCSHRFPYNTGPRGRMAGKTRCFLLPDFAPASFEFTIHMRKDLNDPWCEEFKFMFNGGLIYHGDQSGWINRDGSIIQPGERSETFSVNLVTPDNPWSVHT